MESKATFEWEAGRLYAADGSLLSIVKSSYTYREVKDDPVAPKPGIYV